MPRLKILICSFFSAQHFFLISYHSTDFGDLDNYSKESDDDSSVASFASEESPLNPASKPTEYILNKPSAEETETPPNGSNRSDSSVENVSSKSSTEDTETSPYLNNGSHISNTSASSFTDDSSLSGDQVVSLKDHLNVPDGMNGSDLNRSEYLVRMESDNRFEVESESDLESESDNNPEYYYLGIIDESARRSLEGKEGDSDFRRSMGGENLNSNSFLGYKNAKDAFF